MKFGWQKTIYEYILQKLGIARIFSSNYISNPIFIVGCGRSGTSALVKAISSSRTVLHADGEFPHISLIGKLIYDLKYSRTKEVHSLFSNISDEEEMREWARMCLLLAFGRSMGCYQTASKLKQEKELRRLFVSRWATKTSPDEESAKGILKIFPSAKFIYIVRNGVEVVHSMQNYKSFDKYDFRGLCKFWADKQRKYQYLTTNAYSQSALVIRHEDMVNNTEDTVKNICSFLMIPDSPKVLDFLKNNTVHSSFKNDEQNSGIIKPPLYKKKLVSYDDFTQSQQKIFTTECQEAMFLLNYEVN